MSGQHHHKILIRKHIYQTILETLGLSPNEARIYEALVEIGEASVSDIAIRSQTHRRNTYDAIKRLVDKGLVFELFVNTGNKYNAVEPDKLMELVGEKQKNLESILPDLKRKFSARNAPEEAYIYRGIEGQKNILRDILRVGRDNYGIGAKGEWFDPKLDTARAAFFKTANRKKIKFKIIYDHELKTKTQNFLKTWPGNLQYRFLPKDFSTNSNLHIFGDYVVSYTGLELFKNPEDIVIFVIRSKNLADSYKKWFEFLWSKCQA